MVDCLSFLVSWFQGVLAWLDTIPIFQNISWLGMLVGFFVLYLIVDNFYPKG